MTVSGLYKLDGTQAFTYTLQLNPFRLSAGVDGQTWLTINANDLLSFSPDSSIAIGVKFYSKVEPNCPFVEGCSIDEATFT